jgi:hypothetical protein
LHSSIGSEDVLQREWAPGLNYGLGMPEAPRPESIQESDSNLAEVHELDRNRP